MKTREDEISDQTFHLPEEILLEILLKLPAKSVFRFKCVSKNWLSLISDPSFLPSNSPPFALIFQPDNQKGIHYSIFPTWKSFSHPFPSDQIPGLKVEATSNDLILYQSNCLYFIANPFTRKFIKLPLHSRRRSYGYTGLISSVKNGITSYNVVRLIKNSDAEHSLNLETYSSEKGEWMNMNIKLKCGIFNIEVDMRPCVVFRGKLHWICNKMTALLAYDPCSDSDKCRLINIPNEAYNMNGMNAILGVSSGNLYYFEMSKISIQRNKLPGWKLWVLREYERGEWSLERDGREKMIESFGVLSNVLSTYSPLLPVAFHPWDKDIVYFWFEGYVLAFNVKIGWFEDKFLNFSSESMVLMREIFPLLIPLCPTQLPDQPHMS